MKKCIKCATALILGDNWLDSQAKIKRYVCRDCSKSISRSRRAGLVGYTGERPVSAKTSEEKWDVTISSKYGINLDSYNNLLAEQGGVCKICGKKESVKDGRTGKVFRLSIDHCHSTGNIRGLLCRSCNHGLGHFRDVPDLLNKAASYLSSNNLKELVKVVRQSGAPVFLNKLAEYEDEFKTRYDSIISEVGNDMREVHITLEMLDHELAGKYDTIVEMQLPNNINAAKKFVEEYGSYMVSTHKDTGEVLIVIMDQGI